MSDTVEVKEQKYIYQPTDDMGRPIGAKQVIKYTTPEELTEKLVQQNTLLIRKLRQETRNNRLGIQQNEEISDDTPKYIGPTEFKPRDLTDDERVSLSQRLLDPTTTLEATEQLIESRLGAPLSVFGQTLSEIQSENLKLRARIESNAFLNDNPDYYRCEENYSTITGWMLKYNLAPVKQNFQKAYDTLKSQGLLVGGDKVEEQSQPVVVAESVVTVVEEEQPVIVREELPVVAEPSVERPVEPIRRLSTGLTRNESSDVGPISIPGGDIVYEATIGGQLEKVNGVQQLVGATKRIFTGAAALDAMPAEEYKRRLLHEPGFAKKVQDLDKVTGKR